MMARKPAAAPAAPKLSTPASPVEILTAGGQRIELTPAKKDNQRRGLSTWQEEVWGLYDTCPELRFYARFIRNTLSKVDLVAAKIVDNEPVILRPDDETTRPEKRLTPQDKAAMEAVDRLRGADATTGDIMGNLAVQLEFPGEAMLVIYDTGTTDAQGRPVSEAMVLGIDSLVADQPTEDGRKTYGYRPSSTSREIILLPPDAVMVRVWVEHPRYPGDPDSTVAGARSIAEELMIWTRLSRSAGRSRLAGAGIILWPEELASPTPGMEGLDSDGGQAAAADRVQADIIKAASTAIQDEGSASAVVPLLIRGKAAWLEKVRHLTWDHSVDSSVDARVAANLQRLARALDVPEEVLLGYGDLNHWSAWLVDQHTWGQYLEPKALTIVNALTAAYLSAYMAAAGFPADGYVVWYEPGRLLRKPEQAEQIFQAYNADLISEEAARRGLDIPEEDAPTDDDLLRKLMLNRGLFTAEQTAALLVRTGLLDSPLVDLVPASVDTTADSETPAPMDVPLLPEPSGPPDPPAIVAAGSRAALSGRLTRIDQDTMTELLTLADDALTRALEIAGAKVRRKVPHSGAMAQAVRDVGQELVIPTLGVEGLRTLGITEEEALASAFAGVAVKVDKVLAKAQQRARLALADELGDDWDDAPMETAQDDNRAAAVVLLTTALAAYAKSVLFQREATIPLYGEADATYRVPASIVRQALARAGGSSAVLTPGGALVDAAGVPISTGLATGMDVLGQLGQQGIITRRYIWVYGDPGSRTSNFEPHMDLDGIEFGSVTDTVLANSLDWPPAPYFYPGDHLGCQCTFEPLFDGADTEDLDLEDVSE